MATTAMGVPSEACPPFEISSGTLFEHSEVTDTSLVSSDERLLRELTRIIDSQMVEVLESRSSTEFISSRNRVWAKYVRSVRALSDTISNLLTEDQIAVLNEIAIGAFREDLEKQRESRFSGKLVDQMVFTLWSIGKIRSIAKKIREAGEPRDRNLDLKLNSDFQVYLVFARFHADCIVAAMKFRKSIPADVQETIQDGLRAAVNVYAIAREALNLRRPQGQTNLGIELPWDNEDEELLASSMRDMNAISDSCDS